MRLSLKLSLATAVAIGAVLIGHGYLLTQREIELVGSDLLRDHQTLGHALSLAATAAAERAGPDRALEMIEDVNRRRSGIDIRWQPGTPSRGQPRADGLTQFLDEGRHSLITRVPAFVAQPGYIELKESTAENDR